MAVIKIVPMPGAEGQKGDTGATGPQGPQGATGAQGPAGADAVWYYNGAYNPGASYAVGDVVTYEGQTWYRKHANGGNVGDTPSVGPFWDLIAAKGSDITTSSISSSGTWDHDFFELSSLTASTEDVLANYYKIGELVYFDLSVNLGYVSDWGTPIDNNNGTILWPHWQFKLPFPIHTYGSEHNYSFTNLSFTGMIHDSSVAENVSEITANDFGQNIIFGQLEQYGGNTYVYLHTVSQSQYTGYAAGELRAVTSVYPKDFTQPENIQTGPGASRLRISGTYRTAS